MYRATIANIVIGLSNIAIQTYVILPIYQKNNTDMKKIEALLSQTNQILKEERQKTQSQFKDL